MNQVNLTINDLDVEAEEGLTILEAAQKEGIYIPALCYHPDLPPFDSVSPSQIVYQGSLLSEGSSEGYQGCQLCLVEIEGEGIKTSCNTLVRDGMIIDTNTPEIEERRQENLSKILSEHPHTCLVCPQREGCDLKQCISNVPENQRCCTKFNICELRKVAEYVGLSDDIPLYVPRGLPVVKDDPLFNRDYNLCIGCTRCVRVCNEVRGVGALAFSTVDGRIVVGTKAPTLKDSGCKFCGACVEVCPTGALSDKDIKWADRDALIPCCNVCPVGIDIPRYIRFIAEGKFGEAVAVIREKVPFPGVLGYVCYHPCEIVCRRGDLNEAISICALKCFAVKNDSQLWKKRSKLAPFTGKRVAIIGSGPAGLTAAYYLVKLGHSVTVFEALSEVGGMMRVGISEKILPREILDEEIEVISDLGVQIDTKTKVDSLDELFEQGYNAIFIAIGAPHKKFNQVFAQCLDIIKKWDLQGTEKIPVKVDPVTLEAGREGVFAGGDIVRGPALVKMKRAI